jgi:hypothetical protein
MKYEQQYTTHEDLLSRLKVEGDCLVYTGHKVDGYGTFTTYGKMWRAHRYFYTHYVGDIPEGMFILHSCDNRPCVLPSHLRVGTASDNMKDMGERNKTRTYGSPRASHCKRGHERTPESNWTSPTTGRRTCRVCRKENRINKQAKPSI